MQRKEKIYFHNFLTGMRTGQNVTLEQLGWGLYSADMLSRIEAGERLPDKMMRDRLMERLGFEDDGFDGTLPHEGESSPRNYVSLGEKKGEAMEVVIYPVL